MTPAQARSLIERMFAAFSDPQGEPEAFDRFFTPDYTQRVDGKELDYAGFLAHARALHRDIAKADVHFEQIVTDGQKAATVHVVDVTKKTGARSRLKVIAFYVFENDRIRLIDEMTRLQYGDDADRTLGSR